MRKSPNRLTISPSSTPSTWLLVIERGDARRVAVTMIESLSYIFRLSSSTVSSYRRTLSDNVLAAAALRGSIEAGGGGATGGTVTHAATQNTAPRSIELRAMYRKDKLMVKFSATS